MYTRQRTRSVRQRESERDTIKRFIIMCFSLFDCWMYYVHGRWVGVVVFVAIGMRGGRPKWRARRLCIVCHFAGYAHRHAAIVVGRWIKRITSVLKRRLVGGSTAGGCCNGMSRRWQNGHHGQRQRRCENKDLCTTATTTTAAITAAQNYSWNICQAVRVEYKRKRAKLRMALAHGTRCLVRLNFHSLNCICREAINRDEWGRLTCKQFKAVNETTGLFIDSNCFGCMFRRRNELCIYCEFGFGVCVCTYTAMLSTR